MQEYEMTEKQFKTLLRASQPVPYIAINTGEPMSPQENATRAWEALGKEMGFDYMTTRPIYGKGQRFFNAEPSNV